MILEIVLVLIALGLLAFSRWPVLDSANRPMAAPRPSSLTVMPQPPTPAVVPVAAGWLQDPSGEHAFRYWDGNAWTTNVHDG